MLCLATAIHNFKWLKITLTCLFELKHLQILMFKHAFHSQYQRFNWRLKRIKNDYSRAQRCEG